MNELSANNDAPHYQTYLLICWQERDEVMGTAVWRFCLETIRYRHRRVCTTLEEVMSIIEAELYWKQ